MWNSGIETIPFRIVNLIKKTLNSLQVWKHNSSQIRESLLQMNENVYIIITKGLSEQANQSSHEQT